MMWGSRVLQQRTHAPAGSTHHRGAAWLVVKKGKGLGRAEALQPPANWPNPVAVWCVFVRARNGLQTRGVNIHVCFFHLLERGQHQQNQHRLTTVALPQPICTSLLQQGGAPRYTRSSPPSRQQASCRHRVLLSSDPPKRRHPKPRARTNRRAEAKQNSHACGNAGQQVHGH